MALIPEVLAQGFLRMARSKPTSAADAAQGWADAYENYARAATAAAFPATLIGTEKQLMRVAILRSFQAPDSATPASMAAAFYQGIIQFWTTPPVLFSGNPVSTPPQPVLIPALSALFQNTSPPDEAAARQIALAFHACTVTTQVLVTPPGSLFPLL
jgi:hypothetical protein